MRILLVEDHPVMRDVLRLVLEQTCPEVTEFAFVESGEQAVAILGSRAFDAAVVDAHLPRMSGTEVVAFIKRHDPAIIVLGLTIAPTPRIIEEMTAAGAAGVLDKQASRDTLCEELQRHFGPHAAANSHSS